MPQTFTKANTSASPSQKWYGKLHKPSKSDAQNGAMNRNTQDAFGSNELSTTTRALYREKLCMLWEKRTQLISKQHEYAGHTKGARIRRAQEALIFDAELEKRQSLLTDSFTEIEHRKEQNRSNDTNPEQVEMGIGEAELELEEEW